MASCQRLVQEWLSDDYYLNNGMNRDLSGLQWYLLKNLATRTETYDLKNRKYKLVKYNIYIPRLNFKGVTFTARNNAL